MDFHARTLDQVEFESAFSRELPGEESGHNRSRQVPGASYSRVAPTPVASPCLLAWSAELGDYLGLRQPAERDAAVEILAGNRVTETMAPFAARYGGHQFGSWAGQLGDGRAISLGDLEAVDGRRWEIQLKGAGPTPYSRFSDGRAVLRSSLREFLCSEAMHWLGVPTTRALSLVATGESVVRDMFYSGNPQPEPGAIVARLAPSFVRFGNFEIHASNGERDNLERLADHVLRRHYPELGEPGPEANARWFAELCRRTAVMISHWMTVGFVHGVMNTDNMSVLGLTIDYGPYGWLEPYEPGWTPNTTDFATHRYAFGQQPRIAHWNLAMLARAIAPLVANDDALNHGLDEYRLTLAATYRSQMLRKLGLAPGEADADEALIEGLEAALTASSVDMTRFFRQLSHAAPAWLGQPSTESADQSMFETAKEASEYPELSGDFGPLERWLETYRSRLRAEARPPVTVRQEMLSANPKYVPRNYLAQQAIEAAEAGDLAPLRRLMHVLRHPFDEQPEHEELAARRPAWAATKPGCATLSCSS